MQRYSNRSEFRKSTIKSNCYNMRKKSYIAPFNGLAVAFGTFKNQPTK